MKLVYAKNPKWSNEEHTAIDLIVKFKEFSEELPFTAAPYDLPHSAEIYQKVINLEFGEISEYEKDEPLKVDTDSEDFITEMRPM
jgi:hypothetical protein